MSHLPCGGPDGLVIFSCKTSEGAPVVITFPVAVPYPLECWMDPGELDDGELLTYRALFTPPLSTVSPPDHSQAQEMEGERDDRPSSARGGEGGGCLQERGVSIYDQVHPIVSARPRRCCGAGWAGLSSPAAATVTAVPTHLSQAQVRLVSPIR